MAKIFFRRTLGQDTPTNVGGDVKGGGRKKKGVLLKSLAKGCGSGGGEVHPKRHGWGGGAQHLDEKKGHAGQRWGPLAEKGAGSQITLRRKALHHGRRGRLREDLGVPCLWWEKIS